MLVRAIVGFSISAIAIVSVAQAEPQSPFLYSWTGWYVGGNVGRGWGGGDVRLNPTAHGSGAFPNEEPFILASQIATLGPLKFDNSGSLGGVQSGYNFQFGAIVVGVEADYAWGNISGSNSTTQHSEFNIPNEPGFGVTTNATAFEKLETLGTLRGRIGFAPTPALLLFGTGGLAFGRASSNFNISELETSSAGPPACIKFSDSSGNRSKFLNGWTAGGGAELALGPNVSAKVEYLRYDLGRVHYSANAITDLSCAGVPFASVGISPMADVSGDIVHVGLNLKLIQ